MRYEALARRNESSATRYEALARQTKRLAPRYELHNGVQGVHNGVQIVHNGVQVVPVGDYVLHNAVPVVRAIALRIEHEP